MTVSVPSPAICSRALFRAILLSASFASLDRYESQAYVAQPSVAWHSHRVAWRNEYLAFSWSVASRGESAPTLVHLHGFVLRPPQPLRLGRVLLVCAV